MNLREYVDRNGGQTALAAKLKVTQGLVWQWLEGKTRITAERAVEIEGVTEGQVTREELRPDLYPSEQRWGPKSTEGAGA